MNRSALLLLGCAACGGAQATIRPTPASQPVVRTVELEPMRIDVVGDQARAYDARSLLDEGNEALVIHRYDQALAAYDHLLKDFADSRLVIPALFNAGQALEGKEDWGAAADRYRQLLHAAPETQETKEDRKNAHLRLAAVLAELGQYPESIATMERVLAWDDLAPEERLEGLARLGFALAESKDYAGAEEVLRSALAYHQAQSATAHIESSYYVAMAQFYLGEIPHQQFLAIPLRYPEEQMRRDVEQKSQLFLLARDRFVKTVDFKNPYWATAAIYQVASMYKEFWDAWMAVPMPSSFNAVEAKEYVRQVNEEPQLRKLLEKALFFHEKNIAMAQNAKVATAWSRQSEKDVEEVRRLIAQQQRGEYVTPGAAGAVRADRPIAPDSSSVRVPDVYIPPRLDL